MSDSPSKRQRTSIDTFVSRSNGDTVAAARSNPTTPTRRASYLSPTKASLARSHPKLLTKSPGRSATEPRRSQRTANDDQSLPIEFAREDRGVATSTAVDPPEQQNTVAAPAQRGGEQAGLDFAAAIAQTFKDAPAMFDRNKNDDQELSYSRRQPLSSRQPRAAQSMAQQRALSDDEQPNPILPKLVRQSQSSQALSTTNEDEVDLPPTPVQLGLIEAPYRPRGLASSSSGGSRGGSGKHRRRTRNDEIRSITSSPLKPRANADVLINPAASTTRKDRDTAQTPESDVEEEEDAASAFTGLSIEARQKQTELSELRAELASLGQDLERLQVLSQTLSNDTTLDLNDNMRRILSVDGPKFDHNQASLENHPSFLKDPNAYLKLFSPANLRLAYSSQAKIAKGLPKIVHQVTIAAPEPWLPSILKLTLQITIDGQSASIESVTVSDSTLPGQHPVLQNWLEKRLASPLHKFDVAGLVHGIGQYFEACKKRSLVLLNLSNATMRKQGTSAMDAKYTLSLTPYLNVSQVLVPMPSSMAPDDMTSKQILLTYNLKLTWTGTVRAVVHITCQNIGPKAQKGAKDLFQKLHVTEGIEGAIDRVQKLLDQEDDVAQKQQSQPKKARKRIVVH